MAKTRSRSPKSRTSRAKGAKKSAPKGTKKSAVKRTKRSTRADSLAYQTRMGLDVKKLKDDLQKAIDVLQRRIDQGDPANRLPETRDLFRNWVMGIESTVCADISGPCGDDMFIGS